MMTYITKSIFSVLISDSIHFEILLDKLFLDLDQVNTSGTAGLIVDLLFLADRHDQFFVVISVHVAENNDRAEEVLLVKKGTG